MDSEVDQRRHEMVMKFSGQLDAMRKILQQNATDARAQTDKQYNKKQDRTIFLNPTAATFSTKNTFPDRY